MADLSTSELSFVLRNFRDFLFAEVGLRREILSVETLAKGIAVLEEMSQFGIRSSLMSVLVDRRLLDKETVREIIAEFSEIRVPSACCRDRVSMRDLSKEGRIRCPKCQTLNSFRVREGIKAIPGRLEGPIEDNITGETVGKDSKPRGSGDSSILPEPVPELRSSKSERQREGDRTRKAKPRKPRNPGRAKSREERSRDNSGDTTLPIGMPSETSSDLSVYGKGFQEFTAFGVRARKIIRHYELGGAVHIGPHGRLYRAQRKESVEKVDLALKVFSSDNCLAVQNLNSLRVDLAAFSALETSPPHPVHTVDLEGDVAYLVRPFLHYPYKSLAEPRSRVASDNAHLFLRLTERLSELHVEGQIHGNLKPSNVFYREDAELEVLLVDPALQLLSHGGDEVQRWTRLTKDPIYHSPEQIRGEDVTAASDVYALGLIFLSTLAEDPFADRQPPQILLAHQYGPFPEVAEEPWKTLVTAMTACDPRERPADASEVLELLSLVVDGKKPRLGKVTPRSGAPVAAEDENPKQEKTRQPKKTSLGGWRYVLAPILMVVVVAWIAFCSYGWFSAQQAFAARDRNTQLYHRLADEVFREVDIEARTYPARGHRIWAEYLRIFSDTPFEGAAKAEQRNYRKRKKKAEETEETDRSSRPRTHD